MKKISVFICTLLVTLSVQLQAQTYSKGEKLMAMEDDDELWYEATILEPGATHSKIHWEGFDSKYDETITNKRFWRKGDPFLAGDRLQGLETDGKWYNVKVVSENVAEKKYKIHWVGFSYDYDRWISADSLRLPTKANFIPGANDNASSGSGSSSDTRISIVYLENKTGKTIKYTISGDGMSSGGTIYNNQKDNIKRAPIGGKLYVDGAYYITISKGHDGKTIVIK
ncbi:MAG TPA: hypothetical protein VGF30_05325 [Bacteroidia bacterium]